MADLDHLSAPHMAPPRRPARSLFGHNRPTTPQALGLRTCRGCGCHDLRACVGPDRLPCAWAAPDLCTACVVVVRRFFSDTELTFLLHAAGGGDLNLTRPDATALTAEGVLALRARLQAIPPKKESADD